MAQMQMLMAQKQVDLGAQYQSLQQHVNTVYAYRDQHGKDDYFIRWMEGKKKADKEAAKVDTARQELRTYWRMIKEAYELGTLPLPSREFLSGRMVRFSEASC